MHILALKSEIKTRLSTSWQLLEQGNQDANDCWNWHMIKLIISKQFLVEWPSGDISMVWFRCSNHSRNMTKYPISSRNIQLNKLKGVFPKVSQWSKGFKSDGSAINQDKSNKLFRTRENQDNKRTSGEGRRCHQTILQMIIRKFKTSFNLWIQNQKNSIASLPIRFNWRKSLEKHVLVLIICKKSGYCAINVWQT